MAIWLAPLPSSQAAQGQKWESGVPFAGVLQTNTGTCSATVISEFLAITAKHCGLANPVLKLNVPAKSTPGNEHAVKEIYVNRDLDVQALILRDRTKLPETPLQESVARDWFYAWGYGHDWSNRTTEYLTRADFSLPQLCPEDALPQGGTLCWQTSATDSVCVGDSGGPLTQNGAIIGMVTGGNPDRDRNGNIDCSTTSLGQALTVKEMQPWLDQMIDEADPFS